MKALWAVAALVAQATSGSAFQYDRQLAEELATAYVRSHFRARPDHIVLGLDYRKPVVIATTASGRQLVFVTFTSSTGKGGASVAFEQCHASGLLVAAESSATDNVESLLRDLRSLKANLMVLHIPRVCHEPEE